MTSELLNRTKYVINQYKAGLILLNNKIIKIAYSIFNINRLNDTTKKKIIMIYSNNFETTSRIFNDIPRLTSLVVSYSIFNGNVLNRNHISFISRFPSRSDLSSRVISILKKCLYKFLFLLTSIFNGLLRTLNIYINKK